MEIKASLSKPYSENDRIHFIITNNYDLGYEIQETDLALEAWGLTEAEQEEKEKERINNLTMTPLDFIKVLENFGLDYVTQIKQFLEAHQDLDKQLKYCQNVWCGVAKQIFTTPITIGDVTITSGMVEQAFKAKNGEE